MKRLEQITSSIIIFLLMPIFISAQESNVTSDLELWSSLGIEKKLGNKWKLSFEEEFRFTQDISRFDIYLSDLGVNYKLNKNFSLGANYRFYSNKDKDGDFNNAHRLSAKLNCGFKIERFKLDYRLQFQNKDEDFFKGSSNAVYNLRNRLTATYNIKGTKLEPYVQTELFSRFEKDEEAYFNKVRWTIGLNYSLSKKSDVNIFYRLNNELNQDFNKDTYIIGVGYTFSF